MAFFGKEYSLVKSENFEEYLVSTGLPESKVAEISAQRPSQKILKNGDSYTIVTISPTGTKETVFKSGVEFDDTIGDDKIPITTKYTVDGNTVTQTIKSDRGSATFKREFNGDDLVVTITGDKFDGVAKRFYKKV